jgi:hypothetical protein
MNSSVEVLRVLPLDGIAPGAAAEQVNRGSPEQPKTNQRRIRDGAGGSGFSEVRKFESPMVQNRASSAASLLSTNPATRRY